MREVGTAASGMKDLVARAAVRWWRLSSETSLARLEEILSVHGTEGANKRFVLQVIANPFFSSVVYHWKRSSLYSSVVSVSARTFQRRKSQVEQRHEDCCFEMKEGKLGLALFCGVHRRFQSSPQTVLVRAGAIACAADPASIRVTG